MSASSLSILIDTVKRTAEGVLNYIKTGGELDKKAIGEAVKATTAAFNSNPDFSDADKKTIQEATTTAMGGLGGEKSKKGSEEGGESSKGGEGSKSSEGGESEDSEKKNAGFLFLILSMLAELLQVQQNSKAQQDQSNAQQNAEQNQKAQRSLFDMAVELATRLLSMQNSTKYSSNRQHAATNIY